MASSATQMAKRTAYLVMRKPNPRLQLRIHAQQMPQRVQFKLVERPVDSSLKQRLELVHARLDLGARSLGAIGICICAILPSTVRAVLLGLRVWL